MVFKSNIGKYMHSVIYMLWLIINEKCCVFKNYCRTPIDYLIY